MLLHQCRECKAVGKVSYGHEAYAICLVSGNRVEINLVACPSFQPERHIDWSGTVEKEAKDELRGVQSFHQGVFNG